MCLILSIAYHWHGKYSLLCFPSALKVCFDFSNSPMTSSLTPRLFGNMLFNFQIFGDFPDVFRLFISHLILLWSENIESSFFEQQTLFLSLNSHMWPVAPMIVFYCCLTNYHKLSSSRNTSYLIVL